jgi:hypothetical protein
MTPVNTAQAAVFIPLNDIVLVVTINSLQLESTRV